MKTFLLIGLVRDAAKNRLFPKPLCTVRASNLTLAALQLGGHLHDPSDEDDRILSALLWPDMPSAVFRCGDGTGPTLAAALAAADALAALPEDLDALKDGDGRPLETFEKIILGQIPTVG